MPMHVVHVEAEPALRTILASGFKAFEPGINLHQFARADEALPYIAAQGNAIDLFILDLAGPGLLSGLELAHRIRALSLPGCIVLTSDDQAPAAERLSALHGEFLPKPWNMLREVPRLLTYRLPDRPATRNPQAATSLTSSLGDPQAIVLAVGDEHMILPRTAELVLGWPASADQPRLVDLTRWGARAEGVSRRHLKLLRMHELVYAIDLNSSRGTWLNGHRLIPHSTYILRDGDDLYLATFHVGVSFQPWPGPHAPPKADAEPPATASSSR